ncbi:MAG: putative Ig domain-containing protein, partial [Blastocatellia bacterium]
MTPTTQRSHSNSGLTTLQSVRVIQDSGIKFEIADNAAAIFPDGVTNRTVFLNLVEQSRTPVELPPGVFSSAIAQLTPFRVKLTPGGKLIFPNRDMLPANSQPRLYRFDQTLGSPTLGTFVDAGPATVSASGEFIETLPTAITETSIFLAAAPRRVTTVIGRVVENDGATPVRGAIARANGQEAITDGNGGFALRNVSVPDNMTTLVVEASIQRPSGRIDRTQSPSTTAVLNSVTSVGNLVLPPIPPNRPPVVVAPSNLEVTEGLVLQATVLAYDPDSDRPLQVRLDGPGFARLDADSSNANTYTLRLAPPAGSAQTYRLTITATDVDGASTSQPIQLTVKVNRPPTLAAPALRFATPGQLLSFIISATDLDNTQPGIAPPQTFTFSDTNLPPGATLTRLADGMSARFDWTPAVATTGTFTPSFTATDNGTPPLDSATRSTTIKVGPPWTRTGSIEAAQTFALLSVGSNLYAGTSGGVFLSTDQGGSWNERNKGLTTLHVNALASSAANLLAGTNGGGVFRSADNGQNWTN